MADQPKGEFGRERDNDKPIESPLIVKLQEATVRIEERERRLDQYMRRRHRREILDMEFLI